MLNDGFQFKHYNPHLFNHRLRVMMRARRMSNDELGERTGIHWTTISHYRTKRRVPLGDNLCKIAEVLGVSTEYLLGAGDEESY